MIWVSIILSILEALPQLITVFKEIWDAIHRNPLNPAPLHAFNQLLLTHKDNPAGAEAAVRAFHAQHVLGQPAPTP